MSIQYVAGNEITLAIDKTSAECEITKILLRQESFRLIHPPISFSLTQ